MSKFPDVRLAYTRDLPSGERFGKCSIPGLDVNRVADALSQFDAGFRNRLFPASAAMDAISAINPRAMAAYFHPALTRLPAGDEFAVEMFSALAVACESRFFCSCRSSARRSDAV